MKNTRGRILWIDDTLKTQPTNQYNKSELEPYIKFLEHNSYFVSFTESRTEGIALLKEWSFDAILLTNEKSSKHRDLLYLIRRIDAHIPIILLTGAVESEIVEQAGLFNISDFLIMPTNPRQLVASLTLILEKQTTHKEFIPQAYIEDFNQNYTASEDKTQTSQVNLSDTTISNEWQTWVETYLHFLEWDIRFDDLANIDELKEIHSIEKREANLAFTEYIQNTYSTWLENEDSPTLSVDLIDKFVIPEIQVGKSVLFIVIDCMRLDHWLKIEPLLYNDFQITKHYYYSILPTTTRYARNSIFSGLFPRDLANRYPDLYAEPDEGHTSINRYEKELMLLQLERYGIVLKPTPHYFKIFDERGEIQYLQWFSETKRISFAAVVVDFIDMLTHLRSDESIIQQLIPNDEAFRSLAQTWFKNSRLYNIIQIAAERGMTVILTSDHGSVCCRKPAKISSQHELSSGLRAKEGKNISCDPETGFVIKNPESYRLPSQNDNKEYILALEDNYFVFERQFNAYKDIFNGSFQHGGISFEEMILPCMVLEPR